MFERILRFWSSLTGRPTAYALPKPAPPAPLCSVSDEEWLIIPGPDDWARSARQYSEMPEELRDGRIQTMSNEWLLRNEVRLLPVLAWGKFFLTDIQREISKRGIKQNLNVAQNPTVTISQVK